MSKRSLSLAVLPPPKRTHTLNSSWQHHQARSSFDVLYDEVILLIFSYLSWSDLCAIQVTNSYWSRLASDNQLWKSLYLDEYGRQRLRGVRGFIGRGDGREVRSLPGRAKAEGIKDWKWMFRISSNWRTGRCSLQTLDTGVDYPLSSPASPPSEQTHILLAGSVTITASSQTSAAPFIALTSPAHDAYHVHCRSSVQTHITALALDQSAPESSSHVRLLSFLSTGEFTLFSVNHRMPSYSSRLLTYVPAARTARTSPIIQAVYHHPLLVTLSRSFHLSLYDLSSNSVQHTQTLTSFTSYPPSSLVLSTHGDGYKLVLAYAIPVYPEHWSVGATELRIAAGSLTVAASRTTRSTDLPAGWIDEGKLRAAREQWGRKVARVADTQTDGKWVVLAPADPGPSAFGSSSAALRTATPESYAKSSLRSATALQLYRIHFPSSTSPSSSPKLTFVRTLHGQIGPTSALALADGRCVSFGVNGSIWVWDLEGGTGTEVGPSAVSHEVMEAQPERVYPVKGTVVFDERRILSADAEGVHVWRFDV